jgi:hypothetical protein
MQCARCTPSAFLVIAAACLIVTAVAASALLVIRHQRSAPAVVSPIHMPLGPKFAFSFHVGDLPPALAVVAQGIEPTGQWALVGRKLSADCLPLQPSAQDPERRHECLGFSPTQGGSATVTNDGYLQLGYVFIFSKGEFDPAVMTAATTVDINGARGLFSQIAQPLSAPALRLGYSSSAPLRTIAWPYARERWAVAVWRNNTDTDARESVIALARATGIGGSHTARVPFTITSGWRHNVRSGEPLPGHSASASACRPERYRASIASSRNRSRSGYSDVSATSSALALECRPSSRSISSLLPSASTRISPSRSLCCSANGPGTPNSGAPCHS